MYASEKVLLSRAVPEQSTAELVEAAVREHTRLVYQVAYAVLHHPEEAEDAVQETFIRVWKHARKLPGILNQRAWLARIAWRVACDRRRRRTEIFVAREMDLPDLPAGGIGTEARLIHAQQVEILQRMVAMLPGELREVFALSTVEEMTSVEIAEVLRIPESTARGRLLRARQMLKEKIQAVMERKQKRGVGA
jgi:RNA polymerase sigma-70 factor (ECF subfamily)